MSKIRSKGTRFETEFIRELKKASKLPFKTNWAELRGKPDIVFLSSRVCVFLDSDFWHGWQYPRWRHLLKNAYWKEKILSNRRRDAITTKYLRRHGWRVLRLWGHNISRDMASAVQRVVRQVGLSRNGGDCEKEKSRGI